MNQSLQSALTLAEEYGIPVFPCRSRTETINGKEYKAKSPLTKHGFKDASTNVEQVSSWFDFHKDALVGVPTGEASKILAVDVDPIGAQWYSQNAHRLDCGRVHRTRRGHHLLYKMPNLDIRISASKVATGIDVRGNDGYIVWWPAHGFEATGDLADLTPPPQWLLDTLIAPEAKPKVPRDDSHIIEGSRNDALTRLGGKLRRDGLGAAELEAALLAANEQRCRPPLPDAEVRTIAESLMRYAPADDRQTVTVADFRAYMPMHQYIFVPSRELWPAASVNARCQQPTGADGSPATKKARREKKGGQIEYADIPVSPTEWLDQHQPVEQMTWAPGEDIVIRDRLVSNGGWIPRQGCACFNLYQPPNVQAGDADHAVRWIEHVHRVFPDSADHVIQWLAQRVQHPNVKINHAIVLGGAQGIGKDTLLEPVKYAVGAWNFNEVSPGQLLGRFNGFVKSVILRISEARDLGEVDRFAFYDHTKVYTAAPPDVLRCDEKHLREHAVMNVCGVIVTSNYKSDGIYLPADDRRHYVAWSDSTRDDFPEGYWQELYGWYTDGGLRHVAAYLRNLNLDGFDPKAPPPKTAAFWDIVSANRAPEDSELADILDVLGTPAALTVAQLVVKADDDFREWLQDRRNRRQIPHRLEAVGYASIRNPTADDGLWKIGSKRQVVYALKQLTVRDRIAAATSLATRGRS